METEKLLDTIEGLEHRCEHLEKDRNNLALAVEDLQAKLKTATELYQICSSTTNKLLTQRNEARKEVCLLRNNENPDEYAALRSWDFSTTTDSDAHLAAANNIVASFWFSEFMNEIDIILALKGTDADIGRFSIKARNNLLPLYEQWLELGGEHEAT
jgi:hypothetical protein